MPDPKATPSACANCGGRQLYVTNKPVSAGGGYAPDLLPGLHPWYRGGRLQLVLCADCGLLHAFADPRAVESLPLSGRWRRL
jgi:hypothetical protein